MILIPFGERSNFSFVGNITSIAIEISFALSIAIRTAFRYCVCCLKGITTPEHRKER